MQAILYMGIFNECIDRRIGRKEVKANERGIIKFIVIRKSGD